MKTNEERERTPAYIIFCPSCHRMVGAHVDDGEHKKECAKFVAKHIQHGYLIERRTVADARRAEWCKCQEPQP